MEELVKKDNIKVGLEASDWKEAIKLAGEPLIASGDIKKQYIDDMIRSVEELGPYIVLTKGFALAHSAPCPAVIRSSVSLITLKEAVNFGSSNDPVNVVMCLACVDKVSHIETLQKIARVLMRKGSIERLAESKTVEELYQRINNAEEV
ncbi:MAG: PTS sugar transporter subunit IIA [Erysipelotrichaceae bacterium]|nr:PTS sugar transporter subunit IIA [Erysipelotrichaceae bacterium]